MRISYWSSDVCSSDLTFFGLRHDDADARTLCAGDEGLAAVDDPMIAVGTACRLHHRRVGTRAAFVGWLGHEKGRADAAFNHRLHETILEFGASLLAEQIHIALVGGHGVAGERAERRQAAADEDDRGLALIEVAAVGQEDRKSTRLTSSH